MGKVFIDVFDCKTPHKIFTGKDALRHACFYAATGRVCDEADILYKFFPKFDLAISWHKGDQFKEAEDQLTGNGVHCKSYFYKNHVILSSQNQVASPLFEFAILYKNKPKLVSFIESTFKRAKEYASWWVRNSTYKINIRGK